MTGVTHFPAGEHGDEIVVLPSGPPQNRQILWGDLAPDEIRLVQTTKTQKHQYTDTPGHQHTNIHSISWRLHGEFRGASL